MVAVTTPIKNRERAAPIEVGDSDSAISKLAAFVSKINGDGGPLKVGDVILKVNGQAAVGGPETNGFLRRAFKELSATEVVIIAVRLPVEGAVVVGAAAEEGVVGGGAEVRGRG